MRWNYSRIIRRNVGNRIEREKERERDLNSWRSFISNLLTLDCCGDSHCLIIFKEGVIKLSSIKKEKESLNSITIRVGKINYERKGRNLDLIVIKIFLLFNSIRIKKEEQNEMSSFC